MHDIGPRDGAAPSLALRHLVRLNRGRARARGPGGAGRRRTAPSASGSSPGCPRMLGGPRVLLTTSCTHALELALMALGIGPGEEVICPSFTFVSTANAILRVGRARCSPTSRRRRLGLDPADVAGGSSPRTAALLPVHYAGIAADMDGLRLAADRGLRVVEDAAQGLGASYPGRPSAPWATRAASASTRPRT